MSNPSVVMVLSEGQDTEWTVDEFLKLISDAIDRIPPEMRSSAVVDLHHGGVYDDYTNLRIWYRN